VIREIDPAKAKAELHAGEEMAFLDVREAGEFGQGHPLFAVPCPYSRLELQVGGLVPNLRAPILLIDGGDRVAVQAARRLEAIGYANVAIVSGGAPGWEDAGFTLFKGVNVPSKTLGELAETVWHPTTVDAARLRDWRTAGREFHLFDARPPAEYAKMHIPGARCLPNGELAHRFSASVADAETPIVINCAGRTRGLVGAIGLQLAGIPNPVMALENGTQGWALAGEGLVRGVAAAPYPTLDEAAIAASRECVRRFSEAWRIPRIDRADLAALRREDEHTLYLFDVRSAEEYRAGHIVGAVHAPGGQLVQATDQWIGVRRARVVLSDDTGLRGALAAFWLRQMGWHVYVLADGGGALEAATEDQSAQGDRHLPLVSAREAAAGLAAGTHLLLDLRTSQRHRECHPRGARWSVRPRLATAMGSARQVVILADEPAVASLAAKDIVDLGQLEVALLDGGMSGWRQAGLPVDASPARPSPQEAIDFLTFVHDRHEGNLEASRLYLAWEMGLVVQLDTDERAEFRLERPAAC
jgi:rhodanese-related sulfurtransferase